MIKLPWTHKKSFHLRIRISKIGFIFRVLLIFGIFHLIALPTSYAYDRLFNHQDIDPIEHKQQIQVVVEKGDTLWHLAATYKDSNEDIRKKVHEIKKTNGITATIYPGDILIIPD